jgi:hypothetical protein
MIDESGQGTNGFATTAWEFRRPAYQRFLLIMLVVLRWIILLIIYRDGICFYGDTYIANADKEDGLLIENQAMLNASWLQNCSFVATK